jgi:hypothetical protein
VCRDFHHIGHARAAGLEDSLDVLEDARGLLLDRVADDLAGLRIERPLPGHEHEVARAQTLRIGTHGGGASFGGDLLLRHRLISWLDVS